MAVFEPIGIYRCAETYRYEAPRQGVFGGSPGVVELNPGCRFEEAVSDLHGFERIWLVFEFHLNATWRPKVRPPISPDGRRISVFATRSPHRPNRIGLSCVTLERVDGLKIFVDHSDLLDRTPVLDIKPYIPRADAFPDARAGWLEEIPSTPPWSVVYEPHALAEFELLREICGFDLRNFCDIQLIRDPLSTERKRVKPLADGLWTIGFRTWKVVFSPDSSGRVVTVKALLSNYAPDELEPGTEDKYGDKAFHREFLRRLPPGISVSPS